MTSKFLNRVQLNLSYIINSSYSKGMPRLIGIETTNRCNLACIMCKRNSMTRPLGDMSLELFKKIIDEVKNFVEFVWLQDMGEPLLHKDIFNMIEYCAKNGVTCGISTNATVMDEKTIDKIIQSPLNLIMFAFDGATKETYERIRINAHYDKVVRNIQSFLHRKIELHKKIYTVVQCIYMEETQKEIKSFYKMWNIPGINAIRIRQITYGGDKKGGQFVNKKRKYPCYWPWMNPHIKWDGKVTPCCQDSNCDYPLGNIKDKSLVEIWNNKKMQMLRKLLIENKYDDVSICKECNMFQPNILQVLGSTFFDSFYLAKIVPFIESTISKLRYKV